jgi:hypothetical protein
VPFVARDIFSDPARGGAKKIKDFSGAPLSNQGTLRDFFSKVLEFLPQV